MSDTTSDNPQASEPVSQLPKTPNVAAGSAPYPTEPNPQTPPYPTTAPNTPMSILPYPTTNESTPPTLPYPTSDISRVSSPPALPTSNDPAYPPSAPPVIQPGPPLPGEATPMISGNTGMSQEDGEKQPVLPPYSAPPPSYTETFPEMQQQMPPPHQTRTTLHPPGGIPAQYVAPQPQEMVRINGAAPCQLECPKCHKQIVTSTRYESGILVYLVAFVCILFGGIFGCCLVPFCISGLKDVQHSCPNCNHPIGRYDRLS